MARLKMLTTAPVLSMSATAGILPRSIRVSSQAQNRPTINPNVAEENVRNDQLRARTSMAMKANAKHAPIAAPVHTGLPTPISTSAPSPPQISRNRKRTV